MNFLFDIACFLMAAFIWFVGYVIIPIAIISIVLGLGIVLFFLVIGIIAAITAV